MDGSGEGDTVTSHGEQSGCFYIGCLQNLNEPHQRKCQMLNELDVFHIKSKSLMNYVWLVPEHEY